METTERAVDAARRVPAGQESQLHRRRLPLYLVARQDLALAFAHLGWERARDGNRLPRRADVDTPGFRLALGEAAWIDVRAPDPARWSLAALAPVLARLAAPSAAERTLRADLLAAREMQTPLLEELVLVGPAGRNGWRLQVLPVRGEGTVTELLVVLRPYPAAR
jgi:hypothetical protein